MNKLLSLLAIYFALFVSMPCWAEDEINAFKQGSVWTENSRSFYEPDTIVYTYSIDGELNIKGRSCMKLWETVAVPGRGTSTKLYTYLFTEGDKVFFVPVSNTDTCCLLYDFDLEVGDTVHVVDLELLQSHPDYYEERGWVNVETKQITNSGHTYTQYKIASDEDPSGDYGYWIKGIGNIDSMVANVSNIGAVGVAARGIVVSVDGEIVYRKYSSTPTPTSIEDLKTSTDPAGYNLNGTRIQCSHNGLTIRNGRIEFRR